MCYEEQALGFKAQSSISSRSHSAPSSSLPCLPHHKGMYPRSPWEKPAAHKAFLPGAISVKMTMLNLCEDRVQSWKVISYIGDCRELLETETSAILRQLLGNLNPSLEIRVQTPKAQRRLSCMKLPVCPLLMQLWCLTQKPFVSPVSDPVSRSISHGIQLFPLK